MGNGLFMALKDMIPKESQVAMKEKLDRVEGEKINSIQLLDLKNPTTGLILGLFLGVLGVDRFYKGNIGLGILKLITFGGLSVWAIVDLFVVPKGIRRDNLEKINQML